MPGRSGFNSVLILAAIACGTDAGAADLITGKAPRDAVYRCSISGFIALPSSDICLKIGGHARLITAALDKHWLGTNSYFVRNIAVDGYRGASSGIIPTVNFGFQNQTLQMTAQGRINFDTRKATDHGVIRGFVEGQFRDNESRSGGAFSLRHAFVQFGNWTVGKTWSTFLNRDARIRRASPYKFVGDNSESIRLNQIRYTRRFAAGISLAVAVEDQDYNAPSAAVVGIGPFAPLAKPGVTSTSVVNGRNDLPNLVGALKWEDEGIGSAQISGVVRQNSFAEVQTIGGATAPSAYDSALGYGAQFSLALKAPTGKGDKVTFMAMYLGGASSYQQDLYGTGTEVVWGRCGATNCILDTVTKASISSSFTHYWTPTVSTTIAAGYAQTNYGALGTATTGQFGAPGILRVNSFEALFNIEWEPVQHTLFLLDLHYGHIDYNGFDLNVVDVGIQDSQGAWAAVLQITRRF